MARLTLDLHDHGFCSDVRAIGVNFSMLIAFSRMRAFGRGNSGATAVEFAIVAPLLFLVMFGIIELGRAWWTKSSLQYAVERTARYYAVGCAAGGCPSDGAAYAASQMYGQSIGPSTFVITDSGGVKVCVTYTFSYAPWFVGDLDVLESAVTMTGQACRAHPPPA
jgi:Flp pilus assembly pilin Flp